MSDSFSVGEIAILVNQAPWVTKPYYSDGTEVSIVQGLSSHQLEDKRFPELRCYVIATPDGCEWAAVPEMLRKRRPPQDWMKLCNLTNEPREVTCG